MRCGHAGPSELHVPLVQMSGIDAPTRTRVIHSRFAKVAPRGQVLIGPQRGNGVHIGASGTGRTKIACSVVLDKNRPSKTKKHEKHISLVPAKAYKQNHVPASIRKFPAAIQNWMPF